MNNQKPQPDKSIGLPTASEVEALRKRALDHKRLGLIGTLKVTPDELLRVIDLAVQSTAALERIGNAMKGSRQGLAAVQVLQDGTLNAQPLEINHPGQQQPGEKGPPS